MEENFERQHFAANHGDGRRIDVEIPSPELLWAVLGPGIQSTDIWMHGVGGALDLRVRIQRSESALEISVDRGEQSTSWWPETAAPRLVLALDKHRGTVSARAQAGEGPASRIADLGATPF